MIPYKDLFIALHREGIHYLVAGGFAVNFHQVQRATVDLDLIVHLESDNLRKFLKLVGGMGYVPRLPVELKDFADAEKRKAWVAKKKIKVFSLYHPSSVFETIDVFIEEPKPFKDLVRRQMLVRAFGAEIPVVGLDDLIALKKEAGRDKDIFDIQQLKKKK